MKIKWKWVKTTDSDLINALAKTGLPGDRTLRTGVKWVPKWVIDAYAVWIDNEHHFSMELHEYLKAVDIRNNE